MNERPSLHATERGSGPVLLFVHGWLNDAGVWSAVVDELADEFRCLAVDLPAHGESRPTGRGTYGRESVLGDLVGVLADRGIESAHVIGHSLGGYLALALAIEHPERVNGLGLVAAGPGFRNENSRDQWNRSVTKIASSRDIAPGSEAISMHVDAMVLDRLGDIDAPAVVVVGERDERFLASADVFERHLDVVARVTVPGAGHMVHVKHASAVASAIRGAFSPR